MRISLFLHGVIFKCAHVSLACSTIPDEKMVTTRSLLFQQKKKDDTGIAQLVSPPLSLHEVPSSNSSDITSLFQDLVLNTFNTKHWWRDRVKWAQYSPLVSQLNYGHELLRASMVVLSFYLLYLKTSVYKFFSSGSNGTVH